jgi:hypothetical protein
MAVVNEILIGVAITLDKDITKYALPSRACIITVDTSDTVSTSIDGSSWTVITLDSNNNFFTAAPFIRANTSDALIIAKAVDFAS